MKHITFCSVARHLYGDNWKRALALDQEIDARNVRRWANGEMPVPQWLQMNLLNQLAAHQETGQRLINEIGGG